MPGHVSKSEVGIILLFFLATEVDLAAQASLKTYYVLPMYDCLRNLFEKAGLQSGV